ncbi:NAD(P)/FAD-dependent oxidoreductase [Streptomyces sp. NPDC057496]|uniref:NAD(P)/FAD-dependent oxidoreductase n=1 Tax=Streptomyces sp. NPDC057496 TaxID=3346149 RepID=UPI0036B4AC81
MGGGLSGILAAAACARAGMTVTLLERHGLPAGPLRRRGVPQARHPHVLWSGGVEAIEALLPKITSRWLAAGAHRIPLPTGLVCLTARGWMRRWDEMQYAIVCSRDLLDWVIRERVLAMPEVSVYEQTRATGLIGNATRVRGVTCRTSGGAGQVLEADLVVDASGRGSDIQRWLLCLGLPPVREVTLPSQVAYASRVYRAPETSPAGELVSIQCDPGGRPPWTSAGLIPIEHDRWHVTLTGTPGGYPSRDDSDFERFARSVRHPLVGDLIARAEPLTRVVRAHSTDNRRRYFEKCRNWPDGLVVLGDAVATYNPLYGQGMTVAAQSALALHRELDRSSSRRLSRRVQNAVSRPVAMAWTLATSADILYQQQSSAGATLQSLIVQAAFNRLTHAATGRPEAARALLDTMTLSRSPAALMRPRVLHAFLRGPALHDLDGPPPRPTAP